MPKAFNSIVVLDQTSGYLQIDLLEAYRKRYQKRVIIAGSITERRKKLPAEVKWEKIIKYDRSSVAKRIYTWLFGTIQMLIIVLTKYRKSDLLIITNPPLSVFIPLFTKNTYDILIYDLFPDALVKYNYISRKSPLFKLWENTNKKVFNGARRLITLSEGMKQQVSQYVEKDKIDIIPIWTDNNYLKPIPRHENPFINGLGLQDKFIVMYSGNLGKSHPVEILIEIAHKLKNNDKFYFLIIGGGHKFIQINKLINNSGLKNVQLLDWQPAENIPFTLSAANVGVVTLDSYATHLSVPSKTYDLMAVGLPILAIASPESELSKLLKEHQIGECFSAKEVKKITTYLLGLQSDKEMYQMLSKNSLEAAELYTAKNADLFL